MGTLLLGRWSSYPVARRQAQQFLLYIEEPVKEAPDAFTLLQRGAGLYNEIYADSKDGD
jgi:hypothetical protein